MGLLDRLLPNRKVERPTVTAVNIFAQDLEWTKAALHSGDAAGTLPKGLIERADKTLALRGALADFVQQHKPTVQKVQALDENRLRQHIERKHPRQPFATFELKTSCSVYTVVVVGVRQPTTKIT